MAYLVHVKGMKALQNSSALSILIADDCPITRRMLAHFLKKHGHQVTITEDGRACLAEALAKPYDLLISDLDMPEMSGIECAINIRKAGLLLPIIAITATYPDEVRKQCFEAGMNAFMTKPVNFPELKRTLDKVALEKSHFHCAAV